MSPPDAIEIRAARELDREAWLALRCALRPEVEPEVHRREIGEMLGARTRRAAFLALDASGARVALVEVARRERARGREGAPVGCLEALYVAPGARGRGIAHRMIDAAERWARAGGCRELVSDAGIDDAPAQTLHARLGFIETARIVTFRKPIEHQLAREIPPASVRAPDIGTVDIGVLPAARRSRPPIAHYAVLAGGLAAFLFTDLWSGGIVRGLLLPLLDVAFVVYLLIWFVSAKYRARTDASGGRANELLGFDAGAAVRLRAEDEPPASRER